MSLCGRSGGECGPEDGQRRGGSDSLEDRRRSGLGPDLHRGAGEGEHIYTCTLHKVLSHSLDFSIFNKESTTSSDIFFDQLLSAYNFPLIHLETFKTVVKKRTS